jgi:hypothetical protein
MRARLWCGAFRMSFQHAVERSRWRGFKTGGPQKGTPNKATVAKRARAQEGLRLADERGVTPLDIINAPRPLAPAALGGG